MKNGTRKPTLALKALCLAAALALLTGCAKPPASSSSESESAPSSVPAASSSAPAAASSSSEVDPNHPVVPARPENPAYELLPVAEGDVIQNGSYTMDFEALPRNDAELVVCNAWMAEISAEFWRWEFLYKDFPRQPALNLPLVDALEKGFADGHGFEAVTVQYVSRLSNEQLYTTLNLSKDAQLLLPYYEAAGSTAAYEDFVNEFVGTGNQIVYFQALVTPAAGSRAAEGTSQHTEYIYYHLGPDDNGRLIIQNYTVDKSFHVRAS